MKSRSCAIIINHVTNRVLFIHRWRAGYEYYVLPGGKIESGETPAETCVREAREETGLEITPGLMVASFANQGRMEYYFIADSFSGELQLGFPEHTRQGSENIYRLEWVPARRLPEINLVPERILPVVIQSLTI